MVVPLGFQKNTYICFPGRIAMGMKTDLDPSEVNVETEGNII
jgi:hypothetical protein